VAVQQLNIFEMLAAQDGVPEGAYFATYGFSDPTGVYPVYLTGRETTYGVEVRFGETKGPFAGVVMSLFRPIAEECQGRVVDFHKGVRPADLKRFQEECRALAARRGLSMVPDEDADEVR
jgi:hypothetical protein